MVLETYGWRVMQLGFKLSLQVISFHFLVVFSVCLIWNTMRKPSHQAWLPCSFAFPPPGRFALYLLNSHWCSVLKAGEDCWEAFAWGPLGVTPVKHHWPQETWAGDLRATTTTKKTKQKPCLNMQSSCFSYRQSNDHFSKSRDEWIGTIIHTHTKFGFSFRLWPIKERQLESCRGREGGKHNWRRGERDKRKKEKGGIDDEAKIYWASTLCPLLNLGKLGTLEREGLPRLRDGEMSLASGRQGRAWAGKKLPGGTSSFWKFQVV